MALVVRTLLVRIPVGKRTVTEVHTIQLIIGIQGMSYKSFAKPGPLESYVFVRARITPEFVMIRLMSLRSGKDHKSRFGDVLFGETDYYNIESYYSIKTRHYHTHQPPSPFQTSDERHHHARRARNPSRDRSSNLSIAYRSIVRGMTCA